MGIFDDYKIRVGKHETLNFPIDNRNQFSNVFHVTHIPSSKYLLETKKIIPNLIQDRSKLNSERIKVIWLSPNSWNDGSLYGNIRFSYDINEIIKDKFFYSVEVMTEYKTVACRILITSKNYVNHEILRKYNPYKKYDGPWHIDSHGVNYYNKHCNIEFMLEDELDIISAKEIDFVKHHDSYCNVSHDGTCKYLSKPNDFAEMIFVSHIIGNDIKLDNIMHNLSQFKLEDIERTFIHILGLLSKCEDFEGDIRSEKIKVQICKSVLDLIGKEQNEKAIVLSKSLNSKDDLKNTLSKVFCKYFNIEEKELRKEK
jgi:hypothetical protein